MTQLLRKKRHHQRGWITSRFRKSCYKIYDIVIATIKKGQSNYQRYVAMENTLLMSWNGKDPQKKMNRSIDDKSVSQSKLFPSLFDNAIIDVSNIIKKLHDMSRNRRFWMREREKIVRLLLLSPVTNTESKK